MPKDRVYKTVKSDQRISNPVRERPRQRLMNLKEAADYLGMTVWSLRERIWSGAIPVVQFPPNGRKMYIDALDIEAFIQRNKRVIQ